MVIVRLGLDQKDRAITNAIYAAFLRKVGDALLDTPGANRQ